MWLSRKDNGKHFTPKPAKKVSGVKSSVEPSGVAQHKFLKKNDFDWSKHPHTDECTNCNDNSPTERCICDYTVKGLKLSDINLRNLNSKGTWNSLSVLDRQRILHDVGIPQPNYKPYTIDDVIETSQLKYDQLSDQLKKKINTKIDEIDYANLRNNAYVH